MALTDVKKEIVTEAKTQAGEIAASARAEAAEILKRARAEVAQYKKEAQQHTASLIESMERKQLAAATFDAQRNILNTKKAGISAVLEDVQQKVASLSSEEKANFFRTLLKKAQAEIDVAKISVNKNDRSAVEGSFEVAEADIVSGLIAENADGTISVNVSVEELVESVRAEKLVEISEVLFGNE